MTLALVVLVSGSGSNLQAILDAIRVGQLDAEVRLVISNQPNVKALDRAKAANVPTLVLSHRDFADRAAFDQSLANHVQQAFGDNKANMVVLAGFMRVLTPAFLDKFVHQVINIHPALLPSFPGLHGPRQALAYGVRVAGCTVHLVDAGTDTGPILAQACVPVLDNDDEDSLAARILVQEHMLFPAVLQAIAQGKLSIGDGARRPHLVGFVHGTSKSPPSPPSKSADSRS